VIYSLPMRCFRRTHQGLEVSKLSNIRLVSNDPPWVILCFIRRITIDESLFYFIMYQLIVLSAIVRVSHCSKLLQ